MSHCPDIALLEELPRTATPELIDHVTSCLACQGVLALLESHGVEVDPTDECAQAEVYLAERSAGPLSPAADAALQAHLVACTDCTELARAVLSQS